MPRSPLENLRRHLARADAVLPLAIVGLASGLASGAVIIAFRLLTENAVTATGLLPHAEGFEALPWWLRLLLPAAGGLLVGLALERASTRARQVGVVHVMERLAHHSGRLPWKNAVVQFFGAALSIASGHSVGREGPVIHVGAASASLFGQALALPNNSLRVLVACGTAAAIAASFNTPIAGVIFAMEVVMMEYTLVGFTPVILAAVAATSLSRAVYGAAPAFMTPALQMASLWELPFVVLVGAVLGAAAAAFIRGINAVDARARGRRLAARTALAGLVVGILGLAVPEVMGIGYDTVERVLHGDVLPGLLVAVAVLKLVATVACVGLGVPGGLIGPTIVIGAAAGGALGIAGHHIAPDLSAGAPLYAMLGMGAMMAATLQAPLAALMAILELTANPNVIMPGMLAVVTASLTARVVFGHDSVFVSMLRARGLEYRNDPVTFALERTGVDALLETRFATVAAREPLAALVSVLESAPEWIVVAEGGELIGVEPAARIAALAEQASAGGADPGDEPVLDLGAPTRAGTRPPPVVVHQHATLREARDRLAAAGAEVAVVVGRGSGGRPNVRGVLSRDRIESAVRYGR